MEFYGESRRICCRILTRIVSFQNNLPSCRSNDEFSSRATDSVGRRGLTEALNGAWNGPDFDARGVTRSGRQQPNVPAGKRDQLAVLGAPVAIGYGSCAGPNPL